MLRKLFKPNRDSNVDKTFVIGLDISLMGTGIVILDNNDDVVCNSVYSTDNKSTDVRRQQTIVDAIKGEILSSTVLATKLNVFIEGYAFSRSTGKVFTRAELTGLVKHMLIGLDCNVYIIPPSSLKKFITGKGNADKDAMIQGVFGKWGFHTMNDNIADAYALARYGRRAIGVRGSRMMIECAYKIDSNITP